MNLVARLAEPAFTKHAPIRLNAGALGFLIFAFAALTALDPLWELSWRMPAGPAPALQILLALPLPQLLAAIGGFRMWRQDARGKPLVVASLAAGFVWGTATSLLLLSDSFGFTSIDPVVGALVVLAFNLAIAAFLYYLVATSEFRGKARMRDVVSVAALLVGCVGLVMFVGWTLITWA